MDGSGGRASLLTSNWPETLMKRPISSFIISYEDAVKATTFNRRGAMQASPPSIRTTPAFRGRLMVRPLASPWPSCCALRERRRARRRNRRSGGAGGRVWAPPPAPPPPPPPVDTPHRAGAPQQPPSPVFLLARG